MPVVPVVVTRSLSFAVVELDVVRVDEAMSVRFAIIGAGKVGTALAKLLADAGYEFVGAASRSLESAQAACAFAGAGTATSNASELTHGADLVFITTPDDTIESVCDELAQAGAFTSGSVVAHCSGALPSTVLEGARKSGAHIGSMHPMQSFATVEQAVRILPGSCCCIEGEPEAIAVLEGAARALAAHVLTIATEDKALYHAAGCVASNYLVALQNAALKLNEAAGISREDALKIMIPLLRGTVDNFEKVGIPGCLTGPIARGDVETVRRHLAAIEAKVPDLLPLYKVLGRETVEVALAKGTLTDDRAEQLLAILE